MSGVGATACARHGCIYPGSISDLQLGEAYAFLSNVFLQLIVLSTKNMDWSVIQAINFPAVAVLEALLIYDVACQRYQNLQDRVEQSTTMSWPEGFIFVAAVGTFHLAAHIATCYVLFSLHYVSGSGQNGGEIIETLWPQFN